VHGLRHTFATELANGNVSVYALMKLLFSSRWRPRSATSMAPGHRTALRLPRTRSTA
jgi:integrase